MTSMAALAIEGRGYMPSELIYVHWIRIIVVALNLLITQSGVLT